jgi:hypothetical protein
MKNNLLNILDLKNEADILSELYYKPERIRQNKTKRRTNGKRNNQLRLCQRVEFNTRNSKTMRREKTS